MPVAGREYTRLGPAQGRVAQPPALVRPMGRLAGRLQHTNDGRVMVGGTIPPAISLFYSAMPSSLNTERAIRMAVRVLK